MEFCGSYERLTVLHSLLLVEYLIRGQGHILYSQLLLQQRFHLQQVVKRPNAVTTNPIAQRSFCTGAFLTVRAASGTESIAPRMSEGASPQSTAPFPVSV